MTFHTMDELVRRARRWIAVEELLFETLGRWARELPDPAVKRLFGTWCHRHAWHAELWRGRLPTVNSHADSDDDVERLMGDAGIVRNRAKILAAITNARAVIALRDDGGLDEFLWSHRPERSPAPVVPADVPSTSAESRSACTVRMFANLAFSSWALLSERTSAVTS